MFPLWDTLLPSPRPNIPLSHIILTLSQSTSHCPLLIMPFTGKQVIGQLFASGLLDSVGDRTHDLLCKKWLCGLLSNRWYTAYKDCKIQSLNPNPDILTAGDSQLWTLKLRLLHRICVTFAWRLRPAFAFTFGKSASPVIYMQCVHQSTYENSHTFP